MKTGKKLSPRITLLTQALYPFNALMNLGNDGESLTMNYAGGLLI